jgi:hypothetical protein
MRLGEVTWINERRMRKECCEPFRLQIALIFSRTPFLEREGHKLSEIDLHTLIMHLHLLEIKSTNIVTAKKLQSKERAA